MIYKKSILSISRKYSKADQTSSIAFPLLSQLFKMNMCTTAHELALQNYFSCLKELQLIFGLNSYDAITKFCKLEDEYSNASLSGTLSTLFVLGRSSFETAQELKNEIKVRTLAFTILNKSLITENKRQIMRQLLLFIPIIWKIILNFTNF